MALATSACVIGAIAACLGDDPSNVTDGSDSATPNPTASPEDGGSLPPTNDADVDACAGKDFSNDKRHCGGCNHDCLQGDCDAGTCTSWEVASFAGTGPTDTVVGVALNPDDGKIYAAVGSSIWRVRPDSSAQELLIGDGGVGSFEFTGIARRLSGMFACTTSTAPQAGITLLPMMTNGSLAVPYPLGECNGMAVKDTTVYVVHGSQVYAATNVGAAYVTYTPDGGAPTSDIDVDDTYFYWVSTDRGLLRSKFTGPHLDGERVDKRGDGGNPEALFQPRGLAVVGKYAYVSEPQSLSRINLESGERVVLWNTERGKNFRANQHMTYDRTSGALYYAVAATVRGLVPPIPPP